MGGKDTENEARIFVLGLGRIGCDPCHKFQLVVNESAKHDIGVTYKIEYKRYLEDSPTLSSRKLKNGDKVFVIDFGGGTLDICCCQIKDIEGRSGQFIDVIRTDGNQDLGGNHFDDILKKLFMDQLDSDQKQALNPKNKPARQKKAALIKLQKLSNQVERAKIELSIKRTIQKYSLNDYLTKKAMDVPLETIPVATNLLGILTSPYIAKKPNEEDEIGISRYDLSKYGNTELPREYASVYNRMDDFYSKSLSPMMKEILSDIPNLSDDDDVSDYGKFVISEIATDLTKYLILKSIAPNADVRVDENGKFDFSNVKENEITMQALGIPYMGLSPEDEASIVVNALENGLDAIPQKEINELKSKIANRFANRTLNDFKLAEMILDRTESGLGWRIDATKDIVSIDSVRNGYADMQKMWDKVIDFWKGYNEAVLQENPHAYTTAEITDLDGLVPQNPTNKYKSDADAERKFIEQTGITSVANYNYFYSLLPDLFSLTMVEDNSEWMSEKEENFKLIEKMDKGWCGRNPGFLYQSPADGIINSYTFVGNHDKPRILHLLATDQKLARSNFSSAEHKALVAKCLKEDVKKIDFDKQSSLAIATADRLLIALADVGADSEKVTDAVAKLAQGKKTNPENPAKDITFDPAAFGTKSFELIIKEVFDEAALHGEKFANREELEAEVLQSILEPAFDRMKSIYKLMMVLPGSPTEFAGDKVGATGFETKAKNYHQQNRNVINWDWISDDKNNKYSFVRDYNKEMKEIANLRSKPELSALNDGDTITANLDSVNAQAFVRYNDKSTVLVITNNEGASSPVDQLMDRQEMDVDLTSLFELDARGHFGGARETDKNCDNRFGLKHGIAPGTVFKNAREGDNSEYVVVTKGNKQTLIRRENGKEKPVTIMPEDLNTLILYKVK